MAPRAHSLPHVPGNKKKRPRAHIFPPAAAYSSRAGGSARSVKTCFTHPCAQGRPPPPPPPPPKPRETLHPLGIKKKYSRVRKTATARPRRAFVAAARRVDFCPARSIMRERCVDMRADAVGVSKPSARVYKKRNRCISTRVLERGLRFGFARACRNALAAYGIRKLCNCIARIAF